MIYSRNRKNIKEIQRIQTSQVEELAFLKTTILEYVRESIEAFITGERDLDREWEAYIRQMEAIGLSDYLSMVQEAYDSSLFQKAP